MFKKLIENFKENKETPENFYSILMEESFYVPFFSKDAKNNEEEVITLSDDGKKIFFPLCSDIEEVLKFQGDFEMKYLTFIEVLKYIKNNKENYGLVINPFGSSLSFNEKFVQVFINIVEGMGRI